MAQSGLRGVQACNGGRDFFPLPAGIPRAPKNSRPCRPALRSGPFGVQSRPPLSLAMAVEAAVGVASRTENPNGHHRHIPQAVR